MVGEWAGIPMPLEGERLHIAEGYPFKEVLEPVIEEAAPPKSGERDLDVVNSWYSARLRKTVIIARENGRLVAVKAVLASPLSMQIRSIGAAAAWGIEQEAKALQTLGDLVSHHAFRTYMMTGAFMESSARSGVMYVFRRLRPTLAIGMRSKRPRLLAALCLHPIGYYEDSGAGAMCPTDDVIAHLMMMRGDEHMFWRKANQHPAHVPEAML